MAGFTDSNNHYLIRTTLWSRQIKELLKFETVSEGPRGNDYGILELERA